MKKRMNEIFIFENVGSLLPCAYNGRIQLNNVNQTKYMLKTRRYVLSSSFFLLRILRLQLFSFFFRSSREWAFGIAWFIWNRKANHTRTHTTHILIYCVSFSDIVCQLVWRFLWFITFCFKISSLLLTSPFFFSFRWKKNKNRTTTSSNACAFLFFTVLKRNWLFWPRND